MRVLSVSAMSPSATTTESDTCSQGRLSYMCHLRSTPEGVSGVDQIKHSSQCKNNHFTECAAGVRNLRDLEEGLLHRLQLDRVLNGFPN